ncbi:unnamed protein product [Schistocephalus solidus]|uniref:Reverse transcriptase domain-containing protein n=1 Tax=Schistocephalus solidus TaxID=70667 RepID=A0A183SHY6_SCHSO|nr:unnamed protein product [Schistocephalus solidus]
MVRQLHEGMTARVTDNGTISKAFAVTNGVKQGCVLDPTLFSLMFSAMLMDGYRDEQPGIRIAHRTDGHLNSRCMQAATRGQPGGSQVTSNADQHHQCPSPANVPTLSTHIPHANWPGRTSSNSMQHQSHNINFCPTCLRHHDDDHPNH